jgi:AraC-like DNA-binding protein
VPKAASPGKFTDLRSVGYRPSSAYALDVEAFTVADLRRRVAKGLIDAAHRIEFHQLLFVTHGECTHSLDFEPLHCTTGSVVAVRPLQAQRFDLDRSWGGWVLIFRPEFMLPAHARVDRDTAWASQDLPPHLRLDAPELATMSARLAQLQADTALVATLPLLSQLLRHQLHALLIRLSIAHGRQAARTATPTPARQRFDRFRVLLEARFTTWHQIGPYADALACSEKTLTRASVESSGLPAKAFIAARINLEGRRLLAHTTLPVGSIADRLGFEETTHFVKFFRREIGVTPGAFRRRFTPP